MTDAGEVQTTRMSHEECDEGQQAPTAAGAMLYHSMLTHVLTCATSFHQLYSMMKLAAVGIAQTANANSNRVGESKFGYVKDA